LESLHQLHGKNFLSQVIVGLHNHSFERPGFILYGKWADATLLIYYAFEFVLEWIVHAFEIQVAVAYFFPGIWIFVVGDLVFFD
jgi:hypothetical protein